MDPSQKELVREAPRIERERLPLVRRTLIVAEKLYLTPNMIRIILKGDELDGFLSPEADDNIKMIVPDADGKPVMRSYTPRWYDPECGRLAIDFAVHEAGPATRWALDAEIGDEALIAGPRGSKKVVGDIAQWVMIADETALPALARKVESAGEGEIFRCVIGVPRAADEQTFDTKANVRTWWVHRETNDWEGDDATPFLDVLARKALEPGTFFWIAAEGRVVRRLRDYLMHDRGIPANWIKATGYWVKGSADSTAKFD